MHLSNLQKTSKLFFILHKLHRKQITTRSLMIFKTDLKAHNAIFS